MHEMFTEVDSDLLAMKLKISIIEFNLLFELQFLVLIYILTYNSGFSRW